MSDFPWGQVTGHEGRYWLFTYDDYDAGGGMTDFQGSFDDLGVIAAALFTPKGRKLRAGIENWQVLDRETMRTVSGNWYDTTLPEWAEGCPGCGGTR